MTTESFGQRLRRLRTARGMRVVDVAYAVGITEGAIRQMESGQTKNSSLLVGLRLAKMFGVTPDYLATGAEGRTEDEGLLRVVLARLEDHERRLAAQERLLETQDAEPTSEVSPCADPRSSARRELRLGAALARLRGR